MDTQDGTHHGSGLGQIARHVVQVLAFVALVGGVMVDVLEHFNWWRALLVLGAGIYLNFSIWNDNSFFGQVWGRIKNPKLRERSYLIVYVLITSVVTYFYAHSQGVRSVQKLVDPEDWRNKVVRVTRISDPWVDRWEGTHGVLIEFAVTKLDAEACFVQVKMNREIVDWYEGEGRPNASAKIKDSYPSIDDSPMPQLLEGEHVISDPSKGPTPTTNTSVYYYFQAEGEVEPLDILYFTLPHSVNTNTKSKALKIGRSYHGWKPPSL